MPLLLFTSSFCSFLKQIERGGVGEVCTIKYVNTLLGTVLVRISVAVKRYHDHNNSYKGKYLIGTDLQFRGTHGVGEGAKISTSRSVGSRKREKETGPGFNIWNLKTCCPQ